MRVSFDTNILIYAADVDAGERHAASVDLLARAAGADCVLMMQSLAEFFDAATRKAKLSPADAAGFINHWRNVFPVHAADTAALMKAVDAVSRHKLSFWDAMIWATAQQAGCRLLISEDFQDGRTLDSVTFVNPFAPGNADLLQIALPRWRPV